RAGHEPAFRVAANESRRPLPMTGGVAMGVLDDFEYESREEKLRPGDALFLYTDGLTDAVNLNGELFGKERLESTLDGASSRSPEEIVDHVWSEILGYSAGAPAADDMTCLVLRRQ
ncbi:MAG: PP2C family protein-serine/threonine phosphatase, partial [Acidobacteria bacterium]|nr:PP2C family protein-serine/threonine phosphatase [Acidobacteriota bacterium]